MPDRARPAPTGQLRLGIACRNGRSYAHHQFHQGALRVLRPHYPDSSGTVSYTTINPGGAYLGADTYTFDLDVDSGAALLLTTQSATKVYRTPQGPARQDTTICLGPHAVLENLPDQLIVYQGGSYRQSTHVTMHPTASLVMSETITPGWAPDGAAFTYDELRLRTQVDVATSTGPRIFAVDQLRLVPGPDTSGIGVMEGHTHVGQLLAVDARVDDDLVGEIATIVDSSRLRAAVTRIGSPVPDTDPPLSGLAVRALGNRTEDLTRLQLTVVDLLRDRWRGHPPVRLRKY